MKNNERTEMISEANSSTKLSSYQSVNKSSHTSQITYLCQK